MRRRLPPLRGLEAFEVAARQGTIGRAARELCLTDSAISRQIRAVELDLGRPLLRRLPGGLALTAAGETFLPVVRQALDALEDAARRIRRSSNQRALTVACRPTFALRWLIPRLPGLTAAHPQLSIDLGLPDDPPREPRKRFDAMVVRDRGNAGGGLSHALVAEQIGPVCGAASDRTLLEAGGSSWRQIRWLVAETRPDAVGEWARAARIDLGGGPVVSRAARLPFLFLALEGAEAGLGVTIAPRLLVQDAVDAGRLAAPLGFVESGWSLCLLLEPRDGMRASTDLFRDWLLAELDEARHVFDEPP